MNTGTGCLLFSRIFCRGLKKTPQIEVILLKDMESLGQKGALVRVRPGYMRHTLYPKGVAIYATDVNIIKFAKPYFQNDPTTNRPTSTYMDRVKSIESQLNNNISNNNNNNHSVNNNPTMTDPIPTVASSMQGNVDVNKVNVFFRGGGAAMKLNFKLFKNYHRSSKYTNKLEAITDIPGGIPIYRVMDETGVVINKSDEPKFTKEMCHKIMKNLIKISVMDQILYDAQRQGRISFYMTNTGEEAIHIGSAAALKDDDPIYAQYREVGVLLWRGFTLGDIMNQCYGNELDLGKGRQMPIHYGSAKHYFQTISSPLGTQIPQAAGAAYALKMSKKANAVICYFGEGAASEGDFHAGLNIAATTEAPVIFFCRNNHFAISTNLQEQYRGDGIASRGVGYGIPTVRIDGNDLLAVFNATKWARQTSLEKNTPTLIEAITYRIGHHSTSDDSTAYRGKEEIESWNAKNNPIARFSNYTYQKGWWSDKETKEYREETRKEILMEFASAEKVKKPPIDELFTDVYDEIPWNLKEQKEELYRILRDYPDKYPLDIYGIQKAK